MLDFTSNAPSAILTWPRGVGAVRRSRVLDRTRWGAVWHRERFNGVADSALSHHLQSRKSTSDQVKEVKDISQPHVSRRSRYTFLTAQLGRFDPSGYPSPPQTKPPLDPRDFELFRSPTQWVLQTHP